MAKDITLWDQVNKKWLEFKEAREIARSYGFEYFEDWRDLVEDKYSSLQHLPENVPSNPDYIYKYHGWKNWKDWLINPTKRIQYTPFFEAREFVRCLRLKAKSEWFDYIQGKDPVHNNYQLVIPLRPHLEYRDKGWEGWTDWLGKAIPFKAYKTTKKFIAHVGMKTRNDWNKYCKTGFERLGKKPKNIYAYPEVAYQNRGWVSWDDWFGISLFDKRKKKPDYDVPEGKTPCRCKGLDPNCIMCDGKGFY